MSSIDVVLDDVSINVSVDNPVVLVTAGGGPSGGGGGGGMDQATADARYVNVSGDTVDGTLVVINDDHTQDGMLIRRTDPALSTADPDIFVIFNGPGMTDNERGSWANEKGQWRTSNVTAPAEDALKVIGSNAAQGNVAAFIKQDGTIFVRVGANGTLIAEVGLRLVAGAAAGRVLVGDSSGNATWQVVPVATGAAPPASPYVGQLWSDPA